MKQSVEQFQNLIWSFYKKHKRHFPWRETTDPYKILVSEIMLQQTQTSRVVTKYQEFLKNFPTLESLAEANLQQVLKVWIGLGYNRRAKFLHECAKHIYETHHGKFPKDTASLVKLKGIGQSTAGALMNFAFNIPTPFIETNIRTVFIHCFYENSKEKISDRHLVKLIYKTLPTKNTRDWFYALYDYGAHLKQNLPKDPAQKSTTYKKQSKFKGSFREKRSFVLKHLVKQALNETQVQKLFKEKFDSIDVEPILDSLIKDKMLEYKRQKYSILK